MRKQLILTTALVALALPAQAKEASHAGAGTIGCAQFLASVKDVKQYGPDVEKFYFSWAQGFMTAVNVFLDSGAKPTADLLALPITAQQRAIHAYCEKHPSEQYADAVEDLFKRLPKMAADTEEEKF